MSGIVRSFFSGQSGGHSTGFNPDQNDFDWKTKMEGVGRIPKEISQGGLIRETQAADKAEATAYLVQKYTYERRRNMNALARTHNSMAQHTQQSMATSEKMGRIEAKLGKQVANFQLNEKVNNTSVNTYRTALQDASNVLDF